MNIDKIVKQQATKLRIDHLTNSLSELECIDFLKNFLEAINYSQCCVTHQGKETQNIEVGDVERAVVFNLEASQLKTCEVDEQLLDSMNKLKDSEKYKKPTRKRF